MPILIFDKLGGIYFFSLKEMEFMVNIGFL
jgi:hypothetical protein